jgi:hypothetical protein
MDILIILIAVTITLVYRSLELGMTASGGRFKRSIDRELKSDDVFYDLAIPTIFLFSIIFLKGFNSYLKPALCFEGSLIPAPNWCYSFIEFTTFINKSRAILWINKYKLIKWHEAYGEYLIVIGTYLIVIVAKAIKKNKIQFDNNHWLEYEKALGRAKKVRALNLSSIDQFFEPTGFRYFLGQIIERKNRKSDEGLEIHRVVIIPDGESLRDSWIMNYNPFSNDMNKEYRVFHNFVELHKLHGIKLFFATEKEVLAFVNTGDSSEALNAIHISGKRAIRDRIPIGIYFFLFVIGIVPLFYVLFFVTKKASKFVQKISKNPVCFFVTNRVWISICNIMPVFEKKSADLVPFKEFDLLQIDNTFFAPKITATKTILNQVNDQSLTDLASKIIKNFSVEDREITNLFFSHKR